MSDSPQLPVVVIGGGIIGRASALALIARQIPTLLIDEALPYPSASWGNAGHIAAEEVQPLASWATLRSLPRQLSLVGGPVAFPLSGMGHWLPFGVRFLNSCSADRLARGTRALESLLGRALPAWKRFADRIGVPGLLHENGHFVVWESPRSARQGRMGWERAPKGTTQCRDADTSEVRLLSRVMHGPPAGAIRFNGTAQIRDPDLWFDATQRLLSERAAWRPGKVVGLTHDGGRVAAHLADGDMIRGSAAVVAAGVGSAGLLRSTGLRIPLIAERGYHVSGDDAGWPDDLPSILFADRSLFVTRFEGKIRATSFTEFTGMNHPPNPDHWRTIERHIDELGLPFGSMRERWHGSRPTLPDYLPAIGTVTNTPIHYAFGHQHLGLTLGPVTGELVADLIGGRPMADLSPFDLRRF